MKDPKHVMRLGRCRRCALGIRDNGGFCPPGFWMTKAQAETWDSLPTERARDAFEASLRTTSALPVKP